MCPWVGCDGLYNSKTSVFIWDQLFTDFIILLLWQMSPTVKAIIPYFPLASVLFSQVRGKWQWVHFGPLWRPAYNLGKRMVGLAKRRFLNYFLFSLSLKSQDSNPLHLVPFDNQSLLSRLLWTKCFCHPGFICWNLFLKVMLMEGGAFGRWLGRGSGGLVDRTVCVRTWSCLTLCDSMNCSPAGSSVHGISEAGVLQQVATFFSRGSSWPRDRICVSCISCISREVLYQLSHQWSPWIALVLL